MQARPRIDLDGVPLQDEQNAHMIVAIFRYRTVEGLIFLIPESADVLVRWEHVEEATLDLASGRVRVRLAGDYVASQNWLRGARTLVGRWTDRFTMGTPVAGLDGSV
jgi:hypothetical protein